MATIWLNSPKDLNALSSEMFRDIGLAITELNNDKTIKVILIRSRLEKIFCAGGNIKEFLKTDYTTYP